MKASALLLLVVLTGCQQSTADAELFGDGASANGAEPARLVCDRDAGATGGAKGSALFDQIHMEVSGAKKSDAYPLIVAARKGGQATDFPSADRKVVDATGTLEPTSASLSLRDATPAGRATLKWKGTASADGLSATGPATLAVPSLERTFPMMCKYEQPKPDCTKHPQKILVLDFKSGWWAGDGGDFFKTILKGLALECESTVSLEYHHILATDAFAGTPAAGGTDISLTYAEPVYSRVGYGLADPTFQPLNEMMKSPDFTPERKPAALAGGFVESDWKAYTQIWVLSGSQHDGADLRVEDAFFKQILDQLAASGASVLIGAGYGSITHANAVADKLGLGDRFATTLPEGNVITAALGVEVGSKLTVGQQLVAHPVLTAGVTEIADNVTIAGAPVGGDYLTKLDGFEKLGTNTDGKHSLAFAAQGRKVLLDAGVQRYYAIKGDKHPQTLKLLQNAVRFLTK